MNLLEQLSKSIETNKCFICNKKYIKLNNYKKSCNNSNCNLIWFTATVLYLRNNEFEFMVYLDNLIDFDIYYNDRTVLSNSERVAYNFYDINISDYLKEQTLDNLFKITHNIQKIVIFK